LALTSHRVSDEGLIASLAKSPLMSPEPDAAKAEACFERAHAVARQQAKSWELRAAMSMARLWRDQGKPQHANCSRPSTAGSPKASTLLI